MSLVPGATIFNMSPEDIFEMVLEINPVKHITLSRAGWQLHAVKLAMLRIAPVGESPFA